MANTSSEEDAQIVPSWQFAATTQETMLKLNLSQLTSSSDCAEQSPCRPTVDIQQSRKPEISGLFVTVLIPSH